MIQEKNHIAEVVAATTASCKAILAPDALKPHLGLPLLTYEPGEAMLGIFTRR